jgi:DeoR family transcriptional regulator of aga operon
MDDREHETGGLPASVRRGRVAEAIRRSSYTSVTALATTFGVSEVTIRSDLDALAEAGQVQRVRGGAVHRAAGTLEATFEEDARSRGAGQSAIGAAAAALVEGGQTVMLGTGSTVAAVARALAARAELSGVTVITNGMRVAMELEPALPNIDVIVSGGTLRRQQHSLVDPLGSTLLSQLHAHISIVGCDGFEATAGMTAANVAEAEIARLMLAAGRRRVVVADDSRLGEVSLVHVAPAHGVDLVVTDPDADAAAVDALREGGIEVHVAS